VTPRISVIAVLLVSVLTAGGVRADDERLKNAATVLTEMSSGGEFGISSDFFAKAKCIVVIPSVRKAALGFGGQYGRGYVSCRNASGTGWSAPGGVRIEGGSVGLQIGASETDVILLVLNDRGADRLLASRFTVGADAGVAAGPVGRQASAQTDATLSAEILAWSRSRGAYAGLALQGSTLREDSDENREIYGAERPNKEIVRGTVQPPPAASALMAALAKLP
jgi:lipid-binding SYLF domain-containing protein